MRQRSKTGIYKGYGTYQDIDKDKLSVDHAYQRETISWVKVKNIRKNFSWPAFGAICVGESADGSLRIDDGQHRWIAVSKMDDIQEIPCQVFPAGAICDQAKVFRATNNNRTRITTEDDHVAALVAKDSTAIKVQAMIVDAGYWVSRTGDATTSKKQIRCVGVLLSLTKRTDDILDGLWPLICKVCENGKAPTARLLRGMCCLERLMKEKDVGSLLDERNANVLIGGGQGTILAEIERTRAAMKVSGETGAAKGVLVFANEYLPKKHRIPWVF